MAEAVKVIVRCRPMNDREKGLKCKEVLNIDNKVAQCAIKNAHDYKAPPKSFTFDGAYGTDSTTEQIYADIGYPLVEGVTEGYNGTIFAYGQTGCGKSFSMQGIVNPATQRGIIPRAFDHIFETIQVSEQAKYLVHASYLEIYNEEIRDLLGKDIRTKLELKEHPDKGVYVQNLSMHACKNVRDCNAVMEKGWKNRSTGATLMNSESSRSHSIFSIHMERCEADGEGEEHIRAAKLNLVDLAGSERQGKTGATGDRLKEATKINLSLSALGNVISALVDGKSKHIPYRDSKLTRLLQDSLGGNTKTLMVACLSPADNNYDETLSTLRYANRAKNIKNKPKINEDPKDAMLREYQDEISRLKMMLRGEIPVDFEGGAGAGAAGKVKVQTKVVEKIVTVSNEELKQERERVREEYELKMQTMQQNFEEMKMSKVVLQEEMTKLREQYDQEMATVESHVKSPGEAGFENGNQEGPYPDDEEAEPSDSNYLADAEHAVHLATVRKVAKEGSTAPRSSPTGGHPADSMVTEEAMQRLKELQQAMVGGEEANNEEKKEKRRKKKRYAEERNHKLREALANKDGEEIMLDIFDSTQLDLEKQRKLLQKQKEKNESLQAEILDLQSEFEFDRIDYLDTIRKQEQQMSWLQAIIDKIHPCLRRDCNYVNLDKIKIHSQWDEEALKWTLPKMTIEKSKLPGAPGVMPGARQDPQYNRTTNGDTQDIYDELRFEDRYLQKLQQKTDQNTAKDYFKSKRTEKLLRSTHDDRSRANNVSPNGYQMTNGHSSGGSAGSSTGSAPWGGEMNYDRAAAVHGQVSSEELLPRKPQRLESLAAPKSGKKKKKQYNMMEPL